MTRKSLVVKNSSIKYEKSVDQSNLFTKQHVKYDITLFNDDNGKELTTTYQCNPRYTKQIALIDVLYCLVSDAMAYEYSKDISDFQKEFGYIDAAECIRVYNACQDTYIKLLEYCGCENEYNTLKKYFEQY